MKIIARIAIVALTLMLFSAPSYALFEQKDFGSNKDLTYTTPSWASRCLFYLTGSGAGGGAGDATSAGGGGGSGAKGLFSVTGSIGNIVLGIRTYSGGLGGIAPGGNGTSPLGHTEITWPNGFKMIAGSGTPGYGGNGNPGPGGIGGNMATNTADQGGIYPWPTEITSKGQFNLGISPGMDGTMRLAGRGGDEGDTGGGGAGSWRSPTNGQPGQGGYIHLECYDY